MAKVGKSPKKSRLIVWVSIFALVGGGGYLFYTRLKKKKADAEAKRLEEERKRIEEENKTTTVTTTSPNVTSGSGSGGGSSSYASNPFKTDQELKDFQAWVLTKDEIVLGSYGADGVWGRNSANAWTKYGKEYLGAGKEVINKPLYNGFNYDAEVIIRNSTGRKSEMNYLKSAARQYPDFVKFWADSYRSEKGRKSKIFIFGNRIYDQNKGELRLNYNPLTTALTTSDNGAYFFYEPNRMSGSSVKYSANKQIGEVKGMVYGTDNVLWLFAPTNPANINGFKWVASTNVKRA